MNTYLVSYRNKASSVTKYAFPRGDSAKEAVSLWKKQNRKILSEILGVHSMIEVPEEIWK